MNELFERYCSFHRTDESGRVWTTSTRRVVVERDAHHHLIDTLRSCDLVGPFVLLSDENTHRVAGRSIVGALEAAGETYTILSADRPDGGAPICDDATIADVQERIRALHPGSVIAIGAGTINDLAKMACHRLGTPYLCVATAPSMNGFTSSIAAILSDGIKTTEPCAPPVAVLADPLVLANAPERMIASGIGDLYSKPVSNADWRLSHRLLGTEHSAIVMEIVEAGSALLHGVAPRLPARDPEAIARLTGALMLSGLAMQAAGSSSTASGGEHLISHYIDMTSHAFGESHDFHGCQVAVGTLVTSRLYERILQMDPADIDVDVLRSEHAEWPAWSDVLRERFGTLDEAVLPHARRMYPTAEVLAERLTRLRGDWDSILADVGTTLRPSSELEAELRSAHCPTRFSEIGVDPERAIRAIAWSKDIRARYTVLHLAAELGILDAFAREYVANHP
jgi:glycerol-1-phosphate dehydrogenase [NAD(P)+]